MTEDVVARDAVARSHPPPSPAPVARLCDPVTSLPIVSLDALHSVLSVKGPREGERPLPLPPLQPLDLGHGGFGLPCGGAAIGNRLSFLSLASEGDRTLDGNAHSDYGEQREAEPVPVILYAAAITRHATMTSHSSEQGKSRGISGVSWDGGKEGGVNGAPAQLLLSRTHLYVMSPPHDAPPPALMSSSAPSPAALLRSLAIPLSSVVKLTRVVYEDSDDEGTPRVASAGASSLDRATTCSSTLHTVWVRLPTEDHNENNNRNSSSILAKRRAGPAQTAQGTESADESAESALGYLSFTIQRGIDGDGKEEEEERGSAATTGVFARLLTTLVFLPELKVAGTTPLPLAISPLLLASSSSAPPNKGGGPRDQWRSVAQATRAKQQSLATALASCMAMFTETTTIVVPARKALASTSPPPTQEGRVETSRARSSRGGGGSLELHERPGQQPVLTTDTTNVSAVHRHSRDLNAPAAANGSHPEHHLTPLQAIPPLPCVARGDAVTAARLSRTYRRASFPFLSSPPQQCGSTAVSRRRVLPSPTRRRPIARRADALPDAQTSSESSTVRALLSQLTTDRDASRRGFTAGPATTVASLRADVAADWRKPSRAAQEATPPRDTRGRGGDGRDSAVNSPATSRPSLIRSIRKVPE